MELQAQKMLENTKFTGERYELGMLWSKKSQTYPKTKAQPWVSFTHWSEDNKGAYN